MLPTEARIKELRERFGVWSGQFWAYYKYKNLNWYLVTYDGTNPVPTEDLDKAEWFCFGDIQNEDPERLKNILTSGEALVLGWKELSADRRDDEFYGNGGGIWMVITTGGVRYDKDTHGRDLVRKD